MLAHQRPRRATATAANAPAMMVTTIAAPYTLKPGSFASAPTVYGYPGKNAYAVSAVWMPLASVLEAGTAA